MSVTGDLFFGNLEFMINHIFHFLGGFVTVVLWNDAFLRVEVIFADRRLQLLEEVVLFGSIEVVLFFVV